jgi:hypothetical protein
VANAVVQAMSERKSFVRMGAWSIREYSGGNDERLVISRCEQREGIQRRRPREQHRDADTARDAGGTNGKFKDAGRRPAVQKRG